MWVQTKMSINSIPDDDSPRCTIHGGPQ